MTPPPADTATTDQAGTPAVDVGSTAGEGPRRIDRRHLDPATSLDLKALDDAGVRYQIVESSPQATVLRFEHQDLSDLRAALEREPEHHECVDEDAVHDITIERDALRRRLTDSKDRVADLEEEVADLLAKVETATAENVERLSAQVANVRRLLPSHPTIVPGIDLAEIVAEIAKQVAA